MNSTHSPLDLTVTSLPNPQARTALGRWKMIALLLVCAAPVIASYLTYYVFKPTATKSFGTLVQPQRPMPDATVQTLAGASLPLQHLRGQWLLVSVSGAACPPSCQTELVLQRQLRETLGREKDRLDWVWLIDDNEPLDAALMRRLQASDLKGFAALRIPKEVATTWLQTQLTGLYLVDPQGNHMMRFPAGMAPEQAAKAKADINRLLRASSFWDTAGRDNIKTPTADKAKP